MLAKGSALMARTRACIEARCCAAAGRQFVIERQDNNAIQVVDGRSGLA